MCECTCLCALGMCVCYICVCMYFVYVKPPRGGVGRAVAWQEDGEETGPEQRRQGSDLALPLQSRPPGKGHFFGEDSALLYAECAAT